MQLVQCLAGVEQLCALGEVLARDEAGGGHVNDVGVGHIPARVREAKTESLDNGVEVRRRVVVLGGPGRDCSRCLQLLDNAKSHESNDALAIGRVLPKLDAGVDEVGIAVGLLLVLENRLELERDGVDRLAAKLQVVGQVIELEVAAQILDDLDQLLGDAARVEALLALLCERAERLCQSGVLHDLTRVGRSYAVRGLGVLLQHLSEVGRCISDLRLGCIPLLIISSGFLSIENFVHT